MSVNKVILVGNLGRDPETRYMPDGAALTNVSVATSYQWTDKASGEKKEETEWHRVVFRARLAEIAGEYLKKGSQIYVEGRLRTRKWQDKSGNDRYTTEIIANEMQMLGGRGGSGAAAGGTAEFNQNYNAGANAGANTGAAANAGGGQRAAGGSTGGGGNFDDFDDDIPF